MSRRAKIVCTLGPATASAQGVRDLVDAGMDVARLNLSHGDYGHHEKAYRWVREASDASGRGVGVLVDLQGPKIRLGRFAEGAVGLEVGDEIVITTDDVLGDRSRVSTTYGGLPRDVAVGDELLVDDGNVVLEALSVEGDDVRCRCLVRGTLSDSKGINLPGVAVSAPALTPKDEADLRWALGLRADLIALSFVRSAADVESVHRVMDEMGARLPVLAKIEKPEAIDRLEEIVEAFDGIMVARGDLGVEVPLEQVPLMQKRAVSLARERSKPVIVATQMLESMITNPRPTRAEASDVANAVLDGADAVMLSAETSVGAYPIEAVLTMSRVVSRVGPGESFGVPPVEHLRPASRGAAIARAAAEVGETVGARALVAFTQTGDTVRRLARHRSPIPLLAFTPEQVVRSQLALVWGVETFIVPFVETTDEMVKQVDSALLELDRWEQGDFVVIVAGSPPGTPGSTNAMRVHPLGGEQRRLDEESRVREASRLRAERSRAKS
jgi:pyruvate kinase